MDAANILKVFFSIVGIIFFIIAAIFIPIAIKRSIVIVPTGHVGIRSSFGVITNEPVKQGVSLQIPFVHSTKVINIKRLTSTITSDIYSRTSDGYDVYAKNIVVTYQIHPEKLQWLYSNIDCIDDLMLDTYIVSIVGTAMSALPYNEVAYRSMLEPLVGEGLQLLLDREYGKNSVTVKSVVVGDIFFPETYN